MFEFRDDTNYLMPAHFGGQAGPMPAALYRDVTSLALAYETEAEALAALIPGAFRIREPLLGVTHQMCRGVEWMGGGGYNLVTVGVPVAYERDGERLEGDYVLVIWENHGVPIVHGREQSGMPKIFAEVGDQHRLGDVLRANASYEGLTFLRMEFRQQAELIQAEVAAANRRSGIGNAFGWRYIPNIGRPGAALSHATLFPQAMTCTAIAQGEGRVAWEALALEACPDAPVTQALARLPVKAWRGGMLTRGSVVLRNDLSRQLGPALP